MTAIAHVSTTTPSVKASTPQRVNYVFRIQELVNRILSQLSRFAEISRTSGELLKKDYRENTAGSALIQRKLGTSAVVFSAALLTSHFVYTHLMQREKFAFLQAIPNPLDQVINPLQTFYSSNLQAEQMQKQSKSSLEQTELANEGQKSGEGSNFQQQLLELLSAAREMLKRATA